MQLKKLFFAVLILLFAVSAAFAQDTSKSSWYIGFGVGTGDASWKINGKNFTTKNGYEDQNATNVTRLTINFGAGAILNPMLHLGFDASAFRVDGKRDSDSAWDQINNYMFMMTLFPMDKGLFFRVGGGLAVYQWSTNIGGVSGSGNYKGYSGLAGIGYAFWLGQSFNLGINFDYSYQKYNSNSDKLDSSHFWNLYISFYWF